MYSYHAFQPHTTETTTLHIRKSAYTQHIYIVQDVQQLQMSHSQHVETIQNLYINELLKEYTYN